MRIVVDTNVFISGLLWQGTAATVMEHVLNQETVCLTADTLRELEEVLVYEKFHDRIAKLSFQITEFIDNLTDRALVVIAPDIEVDIIKDDPSDNKFLSCARATGADYIISGDRHLLKLRVFEGIPIIAPSTFLRIINAL